MPSIRYRAHVPWVSRDDKTHKRINRNHDDDSTQVSGLTARCLFIGITPQETRGAIARAPLLQSDL